MKDLQRITIAWLLLSVAIGAMLTAFCVYEALQWHYLVNSFPG